MPRSEAELSPGNRAPGLFLAAAWVFAVTGGVLSYRWAMAFFFEHNPNAELPSFRSLVLGSLSGVLSVFFAFQAIARGRLQPGLFAAFAGIGLPIFGIAWALGSRLLGSAE